MRGIIDNLFSSINKALVFLALIFGVILVAYLTTRRSLVFGAGFAILPLLLLFFITIVRRPLWGYTIFFIINFFISGLSRYVKAIAPGISMDIVISVVFLALLVNSFRKDSEIKFSNSLNWLTMVSFIWFAYCFFEIFNPNSSTIIAWLTSVRGIGVYFFLVVAMSAIVLRKFKDLKRILFIWAILSLLAVLKAFLQKTVGFDFAESRWLYVEGAATTHIIYSGIRYFSFFTDAANFGTGIAFSGVVFGISSFYFKETRMKVFYLLVAAACMYGMLLSGTRGSITVPFVGLTVYAVLSKKFKTLTLTLILVATTFFFLRFTYYGQGNAYIRRMRSFFNADDASFVGRLENQAKMRTYMYNKPIGVGIGMSRGDVTNYRTDAVISQIPTDSWYVLIWVETGIIGLLLHMLILLYIIFHGGYLVFFQIKDHQLKGLMAAMVSGITGIYVASYSLEIIGQIPFGPIVYVCMALVFLGPIYDKEIEETEQLKLKQNEPES